MANLLRRFLTEEHGATSLLVAWFSLFVGISTVNAQVIDDFDRPDSADLGNGWIEKSPSAFSLVNAEVVKQATTTGYLDNIVYRPASEDLQDVEASLEFRISETPAGYPQIFTRVQPSSASSGVIDAYILYIDNATDSAILGRQLGSGFVTSLAVLNLNPGMNTTDRHRLRLQTSGTAPVQLAAFVERWSGSAWQIIGQANASDNAGNRITAAGSVGFGGYIESSYTYDNFSRIDLSGGGTGNPVPVATTINPPSATEGGPAFTLGVQGTGFVSGSVVRWNGADRPTTFVSAAEVQAAIPAADIATSGSAAVTVFSPAPGGGESNDLTFDIQSSGGSNPVPDVNAINPLSATEGGPAFTLNVQGTDFVSGSVVRWNGADRATTFVSATEVQADIPATDIAISGSAAVTVFSPAPGGGESNALTFDIQSSGGSGSGLPDDFNRPDAAALGNGWVEKNPAAFNLVNSEVAKQATTTGYLDNIVYRPASEDLQDVEASLEFRISATPPGYPQILTRVQPSSASAGVIDAYILYINNTTNTAILGRQLGSGFVSALATLNLNPGLNTTDRYRLRLQTSGTAPVQLAALVERWSGAGWEIIGQASAGDNAGNRITAAGSVGFGGYIETSYTYDNFSRIDLSGGGTGNPVPIATTINPPSATEGGPALTLSVQGNGFVSSSVIRWNGADRSTTFVSATEVQAEIPAADIATSGSAAVTVFNPAPGGGESSARTFVISSSNPGGSEPIVDLLDPDYVAMGSGATIVFVYGFNFDPDARVLVDGVERPTTFVDSGLLEFELPAGDVGNTGPLGIVVVNGSAGVSSEPVPLFVILPSGGFFFDDFNVPDNQSLGNDWTEKYPNAFSIQDQRVVGIDTPDNVVYRDNIVLRPADEDRADLEVGVEFIRRNILPNTYGGNGMAQVHARALPSSLMLPDRLASYILYVDEFLPEPGGIEIAVGPDVEGVNECNLAMFPFPEPLVEGDRYRLRLRVSGTGPVLLEGSIDRFDGLQWQPFASGSVTHDITTTPPPGLYCGPGYMPPPLTSVGATGFSKWWNSSDFYDNYYWMDLAAPDLPPVVDALQPQSALVGQSSLELVVEGSDFTADSVVLVDGVARPTTLISSTALSILLDATDLSTVRTLNISVTSPALGGNATAPLPFDVLIQ